MHSEFFTQWGLTGNFKEKAESTYDKGWAHIGRFYWGLGVLEKLNRRNTGRSIRF
jgi:hypothetical protein